MRKVVKKLFDNKIFMAFFCSLCLGSLIIIPNIIYGGGQYNLLADFSFQQIPFNMMINESLKEGSFLWTWFNDLGSNFLGSFSFYNLFSPFNIIGYIFPASWFPYLIGWIYILKYAVAGLTSFLFLKRYVKNENYALIGSLLYAFSGFQLTNMMFYHFHDVVAFFPLLLYVVDNYMYDNKKGWVGIVVALLAFTNWFFFIGQGIFLLLYFVIKLICKEYKFEWKKVLGLIFEGVCGIGIAMIVLLPTALFTISNPRVSNELSLVELIKYPISYYVEILRAFIFPAETMSNRAFLTESNYCSVEGFLPFVGILLALGYFFKNPKKWSSILIIVCCIFMCVPLLNSSFFLFVSSYYARWFYMPVLIFSLMSVKCLEDKCDLKIPLFVNIGLFILVGLGVILYMWRIDSTNVFYNKVYFSVMLVTTLICLIFSYLLCRKMSKKKIKYLIICIFIFVIFWGNYMTYNYKEFSLYNNNSYQIYLNSSKELNFDDVRTISDSSCYANLGYVGRYNNIRSFNSNLNGASFEFYNSIGYDRGVSTLLDIRSGEYNEALDFLGVKYFITCYDSTLEDYELVSEKKNFNIYLNDDYKEFGFNVNDYISLEEFEKLDYKKRQETLNNMVVLSNEQINKYKDLYLDDVYYESNKFKFLDNGFSSVINSSGDTLAIYAVPYDKGWSATNNGRKVEIEKVDNGMMAIKIEEGINKIKFSYFTPGLMIGFVVSIVSLIIYSLYLYFLKIKKVI